MKAPKLIIFILTIFLIEGCAPTYRFTNKRDHVIRDEYTSYPIIFEDFIVCSSILRRSLFSKRNAREINGDSIADILYQTLSSIGLKVDYRPSGNNHCDDLFFNNYYLRTKAEVKDRIIKIADSQAGKVKIVPYVYLDYRYSAGSPGSLGGTFDTYEYHRTLFTEVAIFLVVNNKIIYQKSMRYVARTESLENLNDTGTPHSQEIWDNLISFVMNDYLNRLENNPKTLQ